MKHNYIKISILTLFMMLVVGCSKEEALDGKGNLKLEFHNVYGNEDLKINTREYDAQGGKVYFGRLSYIVSNFILIDEQGKEFVYPKQDCYFLIDEKTNKTHFTLNNIPAGNYTKIRFGIGLDREMNEKGKGNINNLGDLLLETEDHDAMWAWQGNPLLVMLEGRFKSPNEQEYQKFLLHVGNHADILRYEEVQLNTKEIKVRKDKEQSLTIKVDIAKMVNGNDENHKINLSEHPYITINPEKSKKLYDNVLQMFEVE